MGENYIFDFLFDIVGACIFIGALTLLLYCVDVQKTTAEAGKNELYNNRLVYMTTEDNLKENDDISYEQLCGILFDKLEYDIRIKSGADVMDISASDFKYHTFDFADIPKADRYLCKYQYNDDGKIEKIIYTGEEE